jgi:hypothetical protein
MELCCLHQSYSQWPCLIDWHITTPNSGDLLVTLPIYHMEKEQLIELQQGIKYRMSTHVFHVLFNHFVEYLRMEDLSLLFLVRKCILKYEFITSLEILRAITNGWASVCVCVFLVSSYGWGTVMHEIPISSPPSQ